MRRNTRPCRRSDPGIWKSEPYPNWYDHHDDWTHDDGCFRGGCYDYELGPSPIPVFINTPLPDLTPKDEA